MDRLLGEHGLVEDSAKSRREFERLMEQAREEPEDETILRKDWKIGAEGYQSARRIITSPPTASSGIISR